MKSKKQKLNYGQVKGCQPLKKTREKKKSKVKREVTSHTKINHTLKLKNERERESEEDEESRRRR